MKKWILSICIVVLIILIISLPHIINSLDAVCGSDYGGTDGLFGSQLTELSAYDNFIINLKVSFASVVYPYVCTGGGTFKNHEEGDLHAG